MKWDEYLQVKWVLRPSISEFLNHSHKMTLHLSSTVHSLHLHVLNYEKVKFYLNVIVWLSHVYVVLLPKVYCDTLSMLSCYANLKWYHIALAKSRKINSLEK